MRFKSTYLIPFIAFLILIAPSLVQHGMFFDGLTYASISRNLSIGDGDLFHLHYTDLQGGVFYDHPPLFFWIESFFFSVFGDHWWVEKLFCFVFILVNTYLIHKIVVFYQKIFYSENKSVTWPVILLWVLVPITFWVYKNNVLEIVLTTFTLLSVYFCSKGLYAITLIKANVYFILFSIFLILAFLTKGLPGLFPLIIPILFFILFRKESHFRFLQLALMVKIVIGSLLLIMMFFLLDDWVEENVMNYFSHYFNQQVGRSLSGGRETADFRFKIVTDLLFNFSFLLLYSFVFILIFRSGKNQGSYRLSKPVIYFLLIGLCASLPILVSPKQREMYLATSIPYFAIAVFFYFREHWIFIEEKLTGKYFIRTIYSLLIVGIIYNGFLFGKISRDKDILHAMNEGNLILQKNKTVCLPEHMEENWKMVAYFQRYHRVTLVPHNDSCKASLYDGNGKVNLRVNGN